jgi:3-keto-disaccharide hydrolase
MLYGSGGIMFSGYFKDRSWKALGVIAGGLAIGHFTATPAQQPSPAPPAGAAGRGGTVRSVYTDYTGFTRLWDGQTFNNWDGESDVWSIENGTLHADTVQTPGQHHIHYVGPGAIMKNFDLRVEMKMSATGANGGIQYRSRLLGEPHNGSLEDPMGKDTPKGITTVQQALDAGIIKMPEPNPNGAGRGPGGGFGGFGGVPPGEGGCQATVPSGGGGRGGPGAPGGAAGRGAGRGPGGGRAPQPPNPWQVSGYQFDMSSANNYTGQLYEGQGRGIVNTPGCFVIMGPNNVNLQMGTVNKDPASAAHAYNGIDGEWNQLEIIAIDNTLIHMMNGQVITVTVDNDPTKRASRGVLSLQLEGSGQIWYRNVYVKPLD